MVNRRGLLTGVAGIAVIAGWRWLGEGFGLPRTLGAMLIFLGILVIAVAG